MRISVRMSRSTTLLSAGGSVSALIQAGHLSLKFTVQAVNRRSSL